MHSPRTCMFCLKSIMEFVVYKDMAFCDADHLVAFIRKHSGPTKRARRVGPAKKAKSTRKSISVSAVVSPRRQ